MALFGPKEKNLPRLTTFFQVEDTPANVSPEETEIYAWLWQEMRRGVENPEGWPPHPPRSSAQRECFNRLARLQPIVRQVMDELYSHRMVSEESLQRLSDLRRSIPEETSQRTIEWDRDLVLHEDGRAWVPRNAIYSGAIKSRPYDSSVGLEVAEETLQMIYRPEKLTRCPECESVFLLERRDQIYCSRRCNSRAKTRRWRTKEKSALLPASL